MTAALTSVPISVTVEKSRSRTGRRPATPAGGAGTVPAGGGSSLPLPGGSGKYARPARRPACEELAGLGQAKMQATPDDAESSLQGEVTQEARTGAELRGSLAAASAVVERRQASAPAGARPRPLVRPHERLRLPAFRFLIPS